MARKVATQTGAEVFAAVDGHRRLWKIRSSWKPLCDLDLRLRSRKPWGMPRDLVGGPQRTRTPSLLDGCGECHVLVLSCALIPMFQSGRKSFLKQRATNHNRGRKTIVGHLIALPVHPGNRGGGYDTTKLSERTHQQWSICPLFQIPI